VSWAPSGRSILGELPSTTDDSDGDILAYSFDTGSFRSLGVSGRGPQWLIEGKRLLYLNGDGLYSCEFPSGMKTRLFTLPGSVSRRFEYLPASGDLFFEVRESHGELWRARIYAGS
jgi:hypothetical protein